MGRAKNFDEPKVGITITFTESLYDKLEEMAIALDMSKAAVVRKILEEYKQDKGHEIEYKHKRRS